MPAKGRSCLCAAALWKRAQPFSTPALGALPSEGWQCPGEASCFVPHAVPAQLRGTAQSPGLLKQGAAEGAAPNPSWAHVNLRWHLTGH